MGSAKSIKSVLEKHEDALMKLPNVKGVGQGQRAGKDVIKVYVTHKVPRSELGQAGVIPSTLDGIATDVEEIGVVSAQSLEPNE